MALKDWKRVKKYMEVHGITNFMNNKLNQEIIIHSPKSAFTSTPNYVVRIEKQRFKGGIDRKEFKTRLQAFKYAKRYMKKH